MAETFTNEKLMNAGFTPGVARTCWYCSTRLRWMSDNFFEELGLEGDGIVSYWECDGCNSTYEVSQPIPDEEN